MAAFFVSGHPIAMNRYLRAIAPRTGHPGANEVTIAEDQLEYLPITVEHFTHDGGGTSILTRWKLSDEQRAAIAAGEDVYVGQLNFGRPMTPLIVSCGAPDYVRDDAGHLHQPE